MLRTRSTIFGGATAALAALVLSTAMLPTQAFGTTADSAEAPQSMEEPQSGQKEATDDADPEDAQVADTPQSGEDPTAALLSNDFSARVSCPFSGATVPANPIDSDALLGGDTVEGGGTITSDVPLPDFISIHGGTGTVIAQTDTQEVWTWGDPSITVSGTSRPTIIYRTTELESEPVAFHYLAVQSDSILALDQHCRLWAWGDNREDQLGLGGTSAGMAPFVVRPRMALDANGNPIYLQKVVTGTHLGYGGIYSVGLDLDGHILVWGGKGKGWNSDIPWPMSGPSTIAFTDIAITFDDEDHTGIWGYGILANGRAAYWNISNDSPLKIITNYSTSWQSGMPDRCDANDLRFTRITSEYQGIDEAGTGRIEPRMIAVTNCGTLWELGQTTVASNQIGDKSNYDHLYVTEVSSNLNSVAMLSSDTSVSPVWTWGSNQWSQLGIGVTYDQLKESATIVPVTSLAGRTFTDIATGGEFVYALEEDGTLWGWGDNSQGQLTLHIKSGNPPINEYPLPIRIAFKPAVSVRIGDTNPVYLPQSAIEWTLDKNGDTTGEFTATMPEHAAGYYPIYQVVGAALTGQNPPNVIDPSLPSQRIGEYGWLFPLVDLDHEDKYQIGVGGEVTVEGGLSAAKAPLAANAQLQRSVATGLTVTPKVAWDGVTAVDEVVASAAGAYEMSVWGEVDGRVVSYNPTATDALDDTNLDACITSPLEDDGAINPLCAVSAELRFTGAPVYIQKLGENVAGVAAPMDGSSWAIFADDNGKPGANLYPTGVPAVTAEDVPAGASLTGTFLADLTPGTAANKATYWLRETQALEGFQLLAEDIKFNLWADESGTHVEVVGGGSEWATATADLFGNGRWTLQVQDVPKYELPAAAGTNLGLFALAGGVIAALASAAALATRRRQRQQVA